MNPQTTSIVGSIALALAAAVAGWLAAHNIIPSADVTADTALIGTGIAAVIGAGLVWLKSQAHTPAALTAAVNSDAVPGVKVVTATTPGVPVNVSSTGAVVPVRSSSKGG